MNDLLDDKRTSNSTRSSQGRTLTHAQNIPVNYKHNIKNIYKQNRHQPLTIHLIGNDNLPITKKHLKEKKEIDGFKNTRAKKQIRIQKAYKR